jgi:hypothetical protein
MMGNQMNAQAAHQAEQERMKRLEWQFKAQEHEDRRAEVLRKQKASEDFAKTLGFNVAPSQSPLMGPGGTMPQGPPTAASPGADIKTAGPPLVDYLVAQHGFSPLAASTVVGNLYQESGFNPSATGDSGSAFGMAQWRLDRQTGLRNFAATQNKPVTDPQVQIDYLVSEMKGGDMGAQRAYAGLQQAKTPEQANAAMMHFFRPAGYTPANPAGGHGFQNRVQNTQALLPQGPVDSTYAPVPTVDPYAVSAPSSGPAPRPGLGPRVTPQTEPAPDGVPVAQGGGEGEVVLPRIGLPFPARPPAPAAPGSVPFPAVSGQTAPGGPVQPNYTPQPGQPTMTPGGAPAPGGVDAPPTRPPTPQVPPDPNFVKQLQLGIATGQINEAKAIELLNQHNADRRGQVDKVIDAQHQTNLEVYKQQQETRRYERGQEAQQWDLMTPQQAQMKLGPAYDPTKAYQVNKKGEIKPVGGAQTVVNIDQKGEQEFGKEMGKMDAKRFGDIIQAEGTMNDMASKLSFALEQFKQTYTGPGAESANAFYKTLGAVGFEEAAKKANAADAAMAVVSQMKPAMRAPGTGSSSDRDMDTFARALPSLLNLPGGNERITAYFQRMADRATRVRELAQEHSDGGKTPLTRTGFDKAVKELGPLFTPAEVKEMTALGKTKPTGPKPPLDSFGATPQQTPAPPGSLQPRPPIGSFGGGR